MKSSNLSFADVPVGVGEIMREKINQIYKSEKIKFSEKSTFNIKL